MTTPRMPAAVAVIALALLASGCESDRTLVRAPVETASPSSAPTSAGTPRPRTTPPAPRTSAARPVKSTRPRPVVTAAAPPPVPRGRVDIAGFERLPQAQQTRRGCDRLRVRLRNASTATVATVKVGFETFWFDQPGTGSQRGRDVVIQRTVRLPAGVTREYAYDVCLPEHDTPFVYGEPVSTSWVWARP